MTARDAYVLLNMIQGVGPVTVRSLAADLGSVQAILEADAAVLVKTSGVGREIAAKIVEGRARLDPAREIEAAEKIGARLVTPVDPEYPPALAKIYDPPLALYVKGTLASRDQHAVAVVGTRSPSHYGTQVAERLAYGLGKAGFTVVSGLARGIDTAAHRGALQAGGRTLAVLGGALDCLYPPENRELAEQVAGSGAVLSEYCLGREPDRTTFPYRNRVISGLSSGVIIVEAGLTSGAMITATQALDQGRQVFAVPGRIDSAKSRGPHQLIRTGARLVESIEDVLDEFETLLPAQAGGRDPGATAAPRLSTPEQALVGALEDEKELDVDELIRRSGLAVADVSAVLLGLEMKKVVQMLPGRRVALRRTAELARRG